MCAVLGRCSEILHCEGRQCVSVRVGVLFGKSINLETKEDALDDVRRM